MASAAPAASTHRVDGLQEPHGGSLVNLQAPKDQWDAIIKSANKTMEASDRNACDVELLSVGYVLHACSLQFRNPASISTCRSMQKCKCLISCPGSHTGHMLAASCAAASTCSMPSHSPTLSSCHQQC